VKSLLATFLCGILVIAPAAGVEQVVFRDGRQQREVEGRLVVEAQDGGLLILAADGVLWAITPEQQISRSSDDRPFRPLTAEQLSKQLLAELPGTFRTYQTAHYLICYDTSIGYAQWCGALFERLYATFTNFWSKRGFPLQEPEFPLVAVIFAERADYLKFSRSELGEAAESIIGYYSLQTNRMTMYDLTGAEAALRGTARSSSATSISQILSRPEALRTVTTVIHEAVHQIAFNCGMHARFSDCPLWFTEGIAMYFETPDLTSARGWRGVGAVNQARLQQFNQYLRNRPANSLHTLIRDDSRFRDPKKALDAYAEAWALTWFLLRQRSDQYIGYLKALSAKKPLIEDGPEKRIQQFEEHFGKIEQLEAELLRFISKMR
jgi:hypothetical protein